MEDWWELRGEHQDGRAATPSLQGEPMGPGLVHLGGGTALQASKIITGTDRREWRGYSHVLHSSAWREEEKQQHKQKYKSSDQAGDKEKPSPCEDSPAVEPRPREVGLSPSWGFFTLWVNPWAAWSGPFSWACSGRGLGLETSPGHFLFKIFLSVFW